MIDSSRFEAFVRRHQDMVYATAFRLLGNRSEAEDIAQTVFLKSLQRFDHIGTSDTAAGWLKTVTRHACLNHLSRYRSRWRFFSEIDSEEGRFGEEIASPLSVADDFERADDREQLTAALDALPVHQRVPLVLYHFEDMSYQEIAAALNVSVAKVKTDMHRARVALRRSLGAPDAGT